MEYILKVDTLRERLELVNLLSRILVELPLEALHKQWFQRRAWVRSVHGTTHIEGNTLSDEEVDEVLVYGPAGYSRREALEVLGTREAMQLVDELANQTLVAADEALIREIHRRVLQDINPLLAPGEYRKGENRIIDGEGNLIFSTPPSGDVPDLMHRFGAWLRSGCDNHPAPIAAGLAHLELVAIHPFYDGNGRTSRALVRFLLQQQGYDFQGLVSLDAQLDRNRLPYFAAIRGSAGQHYQRGYDATAFVGYFLGALAQAATHTLQRLHRFIAMVSELKAEASEGQLPPRAVDPLAFTWVNRTIQPSQYREISGRAPQRASGDLRRLVEAGYLEPAQGQTRRRRHRIGPRLEQM